MDNNNFQYPHSPDVWERETSDGGFSRGWGMHFQPVEEHWFDIHAHIEEKDAAAAGCCIDKFMLQAEYLNVKRIALILPMIEFPDTAKGSLKIVPHLSCPSRMEQYLSSIGHNPAISWFLHVDHANPDAELIRASADLGICGIKLHNAPIITDAANYEVWLSKEWYRAFGEMEKLGLPVLWHVTQRLTDSPYTGGGRNSYWATGWEKGVRFTNDDLLKVFLKVVGDFPGIRFIAAHQLHIGWDRLEELFSVFGNLYVDTSIGCFIRSHDDLYGPEREYLNKVFINNCDRIIFGTDTILQNNRSTHLIDNIYNGHIRFIRQLRLPHEALQKISHENAEKLIKSKL